VSVVICWSHGGGDLGPNCWPPCSAYAGGRELDLGIRILAVAPLLRTRPLIRCSMKYTNCSIGNLTPGNYQAEQAEQANKLKRPKRTSQMRRHTESNNLAFFAKVLELKWLVALVAVDNQQPVTAYCTSLCMLDKVLQPGKTKLVSSPAVSAVANLPIL
jgi:hypothetical protein